MTSYSKDDDSFKSLQMFRKIFFNVFVKSSLKLKNEYFVFELSAFSFIDSFEKKRWNELMIDDSKSTRFIFMFSLYS